MTSSIRLQLILLSVIALSNMSTLFILLKGILIRTEEKTSYSSQLVITNADSATSTGNYTCEVKGAHTKERTSVSVFISVRGNRHLLIHSLAQLNFSGTESIFAKFWEILKKVIWHLIYKCAIVSKLGGWDQGMEAPGRVREGAVVLIR
jgi:hypothetical protein